MRESSGETIDLHARLRLRRTYCIAKAQPFLNNLASAPATSSSLSILLWRQPERVPRSFVLLDQAVSQSPQPDTTFTLPLHFQPTLNQRPDLPLCLTFHCVCDNIIEYLRRRLRSQLVASCTARESALTQPHLHRPSHMQTSYQPTILLSNRQQHSSSYQHLTPR